MDEKTFREILERISNFTIEDMVEKGKELNAQTYIYELSKSFEEFGELIG